MLLSCDVFPDGTPAFIVTTQVECKESNFGEPEAK
jgi:hypothetical protein